MFFRTRWISQIDGLERFLEMYEPIIAALKEMSDKYDGSWNCSSSAAFANLSILRNFVFLIALVIVRHCLGYTTTATYQLQGAEVDMLRGLQEIDSLMFSLKTARNVIDVYHCSWFRQACDIASKVDAPVWYPRVCAKQRHRENNPADNASDYFKINISIPFLDHLLQELSNRFSEKKSIVIKGLSFIPKIMRKQYQPVVICDKRSHSEAFVDHSESSPKYTIVDHSSSNAEEQWKKKADQINIQRLDKRWKEDFKNLCSQYLDDLPNATSISHEVDIWESKWIHCPEEELPGTITETLRETNPMSFRNIATILKILAVIPFTSCTCERSASSLRILKTYLRSTMSQTRLNSLAILYSQKDIKVDVDSVIDRFAVCNNRRMKLGITSSNQTRKVGTRTKYTFLKSTSARFLFQGHRSLRHI